METEVSSGETNRFPAVKQVVPHRETVCFTVGNISAGILATSGEKDAGKVRPERDTNYR